MTIGPKNDPRPLILHVDSETGIPYRLAESDSITVGNINLTTINNASYTPGVGPGGIDPTAINVTSLQGTGVFLTTGTNVTSLAGTGEFVTQGELTSELSYYCGPLDTPSTGQLPYYNAGWQKLAVGADGQYLKLVAGLPDWEDLPPGISTPVTVDNGGTGRTTMTANRVLFSKSTTSVDDDPDLTFDGTTLAANTLTLTTALGLSYGGTAATGPAQARTNLELGNLATENSPLPLNKGGTGITTAPASGRVLISDGTAFTSNGSLTFNTGTNTLTTNTLSLGTALSISNGGTGKSSFSDRSLPFYNNSTTSFDENPNLYFDAGTTSLVVPTLNLVNALAVDDGGTGKSTFASGALCFSGESNSIEQHQGLTDLIDILDRGLLEYNYGALLFAGTPGRAIALKTGQFPSSPTQYGKVLKLYDPYPLVSFPGVVAEPRWEAYNIEGLDDVNTSSVTPSAVSATYQYGSPFVWQYNSDDAAFNAQVTATNGWWGGLQLSSWIEEALLPELDNYYITDKTGYYPSANLSIVSLSATTVSATTYLNLTGTWDLSTLNSYYVNVSGDSANAGFHFSSVSANGMVLSATAAAAIPLQVRFASGSTASHAVFASADGTEIARLNLRGTNNLFLGKSSGNSWSTGSNNVAIGHQASQFLSTGSDTVAIGSNANYNSTTSQRNTSIGSNAGGYPGTSTDNVNIGYFAGYTQTGSFNISVGPSVNYATVGARNVGVGYQALHRNTSGTGNIGLGYRAGYGFSSTATNNIAIGHDSNITEPTTFSNTIVIGSGIASTASNQTIIGHPQTSSTLIRGALSATSYVNAPLTSGTFSTGDVLYYNGSVWVKLAKPANPAVLLIDDLNGTGLPYWEEAPNTAPSTTYTLQVTTDGSNNPGAIFWG